jgi:hypothetical protein
VYDIYENRISNSHSLRTLARRTLAHPFFRSGIGIVRSERFTDGLEFIGGSISGLSVLLRSFFVAFASRVAEAYRHNDEGLAGLNKYREAPFKIDAIQDRILSRKRGRMSAERRMEQNERDGALLMTLLPIETTRSHW